MASLLRVAPSVKENVGEIEVYFPQIRTRMQVGGHLRPVVRPLFPRYFFARYRWDLAGRFVSSRPQVIGMVHFGHTPAVISATVIDELRQWSLESDSEVFDPTTALKPGQRVVIVSGPFKGMEAEFVLHLSDQKRVALLMDHLQSQPRLTIERSLVKPVY